MDPTTVLFAIEAGVRLARKMNDVLVDSTAERPLLLPLGDLFADVESNKARAWFSRAENRALVSPGGPYADLPPERWLDAYRTLLGIEQSYAGSGDLAQARKVIEGLNAFEQLKKGFGARPAVQRILGTVVEIGIDWFSANPAALGRDSSARRIVHGFLLRIDDFEFGEDAPAEIVGDVLSAALDTLGGNAALISDDARLHALLGGVTAAVMHEVQAAGGAAVLVQRRQLVRRVGPAILSAGARAFGSHLELFLPAGARARPLVESALRQVFAGIAGQEDQFGNEAIEHLFQAALAAVGENAALFADEPIVAQLIRRTTATLTSGAGAQLFDRSIVPAIVGGALEVLVHNAETLVDPDSPQEQLLARAAAALAAGLSDEVAGGGSIRALLSKRQLVGLSRSVFEQVARDPAALLAGSAATPARTVLAQAVGSVARALQDNPALLVSGQGLEELVGVALRTAAGNADRLLDLERDDPRTNLLHGIVHEVANGLARAPGRGLQGEALLLNLARRILPLASANVAALVDGRGPVIQRTVTRTLELARGALAGRVNADNLPLLAAELLRAALWDELDLADDVAMLRAATAILRAA